MSSTKTLPLHERLDAEASGWWGEDRDVAALLDHYTPYAEKLADERAAKQRLVDADDYRQEALIGLWEAIESYDPGETTVFTSWAYWRVRGRLVEAERANDWVKPKVRAAANAGDIDLPAMLRIKETFDTANVEGEPCDLADVFVSLMGRAKCWVVNVLGAYLEADCDLDCAAASLGTTAENFGTVLLPRAIDELRGMPCRL